MNNCKHCYSYAINPHLNGRDGSCPDLCDVCYWRFRYSELKGKVVRLQNSVRPVHLTVMDDDAVEGMVEADFYRKEDVDAALDKIKASLIECHNDTNGDGDCGRKTCLHCHPEVWVPSSDSKSGGKDAQ